MFEEYKALAAGYLVIFLPVHFGVVVLLTMMCSVTPVMSQSQIILLPLKQAVD